MTAPVNPEGQTAQEVRRAAPMEAAIRSHANEHATGIRALASTPSPAKQEQKIADQKGAADEATPDSQAADESDALEVREVRSDEPRQAAELLPVRDSAQREVAAASKLEEARAALKK